jgi:uncharacterized protein
MLETIDFGNYRLAIDPESLFWALFDDDEFEEVERHWKKHRDEFKKDMDRYRFEIKPETAYINVTDLCNASCPYCYIPEDIRRNGKTMLRDELFNILSVLEGKIRWVIFHGSEPLIAKDVIFDAIESFDFSFGVQTNAKLLEKEDMDFLMGNKVNVGISLDSPDRKTNDFLRGKNHFESAVRCIDYMRGYERLNVITTINRYNYRQLEEMVDFLVGRVRVVLMNPVRGTSEGGRKMRVEPEKAAEEFIKACRRAIEHTKGGRRIVIGDFANIILGIVAPTSRVLQCDISPCGGGRRFFAVATDGIYPCGEFIGLKEYRVPFESLTNLEFMKSFENIRKRAVEQIDDCRECIYRHICGSPCPAEVYSETGTLFAKSPYCEFYKKVIEFAIESIKRGDHRYVIREENLSLRYRIES